MRILVLLAAALGPLAPAFPQDPPPRAPGAPSDDATRMGSPPALPPGTTEQAMWPAADAEGWRKPCLVRWQRSFDDALRVARAEGRPILVAVNMDGEIASEHWAGVRYRDPESAALLEPYVCVVASVYRHTPRDHDPQGRRVPCPRFGTVTCGEHVAAEVELYEKYFDGQRIAPRHIALEPDGRKVYDVYFSWDTATVVTALRKGVEGRPPPLTVSRDDLPLAQRARSAHVEDRELVERAYREGGPEQRRALLEAVAQAREVEQVELLRQALLGLDLELARRARAILAGYESEAAIDLLAEALKVPLDPAERAALVAAVERLGERFPRARTLAALHRAGERRSRHVAARELTEADAADAALSAARLEYQSEALAARPEDPRARLSLAEALLERAREGSLAPRFRELLVEDARAELARARALGAEGPWLEGLLALEAELGGERARARALAVEAVEAGLGRGEGEEASELTLVRVLALFAAARQDAIASAYREKRAWPPEWLADVHAAHARIARHPGASEADLVSCYDFLRWLGATPRSRELLETALARFPESAVLHDRLRARVLWDEGAEGLERAYAARLAAPDASPREEWFAGYAALVAAEQHRREGRPEPALAAYERGIAHYERHAALGDGGSGDEDHYVALALAGRARVLLERGELDGALSAIRASLERRPDSAGSLDGLALTPVDTARMLALALEREGRDASARELHALLETLDPRLLEPPVYDRAPDLARPRPGRAERR